MARVHGLEHVQRLATTALADDDPLRAHTERVDDEALNRDLALAVDVLGSGLQATDVLLVQLQLGGVLDGDDSVLDGDEARQDVEEGRLACAGASRDDDVGLREDCGLQEAETGLVACAEADEVLDLVGVARELADGEQRPVQRERADDGVDTGAVGETRIAQG